MSLLRPFAARREEELQRIDNLSDAVACSVYDQYPDISPGSFIPARIGQGPKSSDWHGVMDAVQEKAIKKLGAEGITDCVFDEAASVDLSTDLVETRRGEPKRVLKDEGIALIFRRLEISH